MITSSPLIETRVSASQPFLNRKTGVSLRQVVVSSGCTIQVLATKWKTQLIGEPTLDKFTAAIAADFTLMSTATGTRSAIASDFHTAVTHHAPGVEVVGEGLTERHREMAIDVAWSFWRRFWEGQVRCSHSGGRAGRCCREKDGEYGKGDQKDWVEMPSFLHFSANLHHSSTRLAVIQMLRDDFQEGF